MSKSTKPKPTIRQLILSASGISVGKRSILAEVCTMSVGAERGCFDANNRFLADKFGMDGANVRRHLRELVELGLIAEKRGETNNKRCYTPSDALLLACQIDNPSIVNLISLAAKPRKPKGVVKMTTPACQNDNPGIVKMTTPACQNDNHNVLEQCKGINVGSNTVVEQNIQEELLAAHAAVEFLTGENAKLEERISKGLALHAKQKKEIEEQAAEILQLRAQLTAQGNGTGGGNDVPTSKPEKIPVYKEAVEAFHQIHPSLMGSPVVKFGKVEGRQIKDTLTALKKIEGVDGWDGALDLFRAICMNWPTLGKWYKGKFSTSILYGKLNEIISALHFDTRAGAEQESTLADFANR